MKLSAIIPTFCEASGIGRTVTHCLAFADEVIVADGGSPDATQQNALAAGAQVVVSRKGRGPQLNVGALAASGDTLIFVHADTLLPATARAALARALADPAIVGGNFKLRFVPSTRAGRFYAAANHYRRRAFAVYYGDSCIFVRTSVFRELGGFRELALFEDQELVQRLEAHGRTHYETQVEAASSSRRFARRPLRTLGIWALLQALYAAGVAPSRLARLYAEVR
jgi:rSAM/selenodomain-associated transferase 2